MSRAKPLSPDDRQKAIIEIAAPLIEAEGIGVSTRRIANEAGIAEGTLFRAFPTKADLIKAVVSHTLDPEGLMNDMDTIDRTQPLATRIEQMMTLITGRTAHVRALMLVLHQSMVAHGRKFMDPRSGREGMGPRGWMGRGPCDNDSHMGPDAIQSTSTLFLQAVEDVLAPDQDSLAVDLTTASAFVFTVCAASLMPGPLTPHLEPSTLSDLVVRALVSSRKDN